MARDLYKDINWTATEIETLKGICNSSSTASEKLRLINSEIFAPHNIELHYYGKRIQTTLTKPIQYETTRLSNIKYENNQLIIVNSVVITEIKDITTGQFLTASGCELSFIKLNDANMNNVGFKINGENKKTIFTFNKKISYADEQVRMALSERDNAVYSLTIDDLYKINGKNLNKTGFLKYPVHDQTTTYEQTSPYVIYKDNANTNNLKFVGFPEYKINEGKAEENIILNGYCDVKFSQEQVDQYNLPYPIANYQNNKELNLVNYCLPLFNNFDNIEYDKLQIKYDTTNKQLVFTTPMINGKYKIGKIAFDKDNEKLICYHLPPISVGTKMPNGKQDPKSCLWVQNLTSNLTYKNEITDYYVYYYSSSVSSYIGKLHENYQLQCNFSYNPTEAEFLEILVNEHADQEERINYWIFRYKQYLENYDYLIDYKTLSQSYIQQVNWDAQINGSGLQPQCTYYYNGQTVNAQEAYNWNNNQNEGATNFFEIGSRWYHLLFDYKINISTTINNFPSFRGNYTPFSTAAAQNFINHNNIDTSCYNINYKVNDFLIYNYCLTSEEKKSYFDNNHQGENNTQNIIYSNNFIRLNNTQYHNANIIRLNNTDNTPQQQDIVFPKRETDIVHLRWYRYISMGMNTNSAIGLYALWLQTDDTTKQITWKEYSK